MTPGRPDRSAMLTQVISTNVLKEKIAGVGDWRGDIPSIAAFTNVKSSIRSKGVPSAAWAISGRGVCVFGLAANELDSLTIGNEDRRPALSRAR